MRNRRLSVSLNAAEWRALERQAAVLDDTPQIWVRKLVRFELGLTGQRPATGALTRRQHEQALAPSCDRSALCPFPRDHIGVCGILSGGAATAVPNGTNDAERPDPNRLPPSRRCKTCQCSAGIRAERCRQTACACHAGAA